MNRKFSWLICAILIVLLLDSCVSHKHVAYFENADSIHIESVAHRYDARIMPKDLLIITVNTVNKSASQPFNLTVFAPSGGNQITTQPALQSYLVDSDGNIEFPIVGTIKVGGLTKKEAEQKILGLIQPYMSEAEKPIVTVRLSSFSISVLGEVNSPGDFMVSRERISVLQALALARDMTIYGVRDNVKLIREDAEGRKTIHTLNLNDANIVNSPYYYLQQNDVIYVEPNKAKSQNSSIGNMTTLWFSATSIIVSVASLLVNIFR